MRDVCNDRWAVEVESIEKGAAVEDVGNLCRAGDGGGISPNRLYTGGLPYCD